jgi:hypothetical protein
MPTERRISNRQHFHVAVLGKDEFDQLPFFLEKMKNSDTDKNIFQQIVTWFVLGHY